MEHFETHDMGDEWASLPEVSFDVDIRQRRRLMSLDEGLLARVAEIAGAEHVSSEALVSEWLQEKIAEYAGKA